MLHKPLKYYFTLALLLTIFQGCTENKSSDKKTGDNCDCTKYGVAFNDERKKKGLILLDPSWELEITDEVNYDGTCFCTWRKKEQMGYAEKYLTFDKKGQPEIETDTYFMDFIDSTYLEDQAQMRVYLEYDFDDDLQFFYGDEGLYNIPVYDHSALGEIPYTNSFIEIIDYLHFETGVPWSQLPVTEGIEFPLKRVLQ